MNTGHEQLLDQLKKLFGSVELDGLTLRECAAQDRRVSVDDPWVLSLSETRSWTQIPWNQRQQIFFDNAMGWGGTEKSLAFYLAGALEYLIRECRNLDDRNVHHFVTDIEAGLDGSSFTSSLSSEQLSFVDEALQYCSAELSPPWNWK